MHDLSRRVIIFLLVRATCLTASSQVVERWVQRYDRQLNSEGASPSLAVDSSGQVLVAGDARQQESEYLRDTLLLKYAGTGGALLWEQRGTELYGRTIAGRGLALDAGGNAVVAGSSDWKFSTAKYAKGSGATLWGPVTNTLLSDSSNTGASAVTVDGNGHVIVTGAIATHQYPGGSYYTAKYDGGSGALIWERCRCDQPGYGDYPLALAADHTGNIVVTGNSCSAGCNISWYTAKYAAHSGDVLWEQHYEGEWAGSVYVSDLAVDATGNAIVAGAGPGRFLTDWYFVKYAGSDGRVLWKKTWSGPANFGDDRVEALAVDGAGDVFITGTSEALNGWIGWRTAKYAAADGSLIWERLYDGPGYWNHIPRALAVDAAGNVIVTGESSRAGNSGDVDYYTAKYAATNGAVIWERRYNGPGNSNDFASRVAVTPEGGVVVTGRSSLGNLYTYTTVLYSPVSTPLTWREHYFGSDASAANAANDSDPDGDGVPNLVEWACGLNPMALNTVPGIPGLDGAALTFHYPRSLSAVAAGINFTVQWSDTLNPGDWRTDGVTEAITFQSESIQQIRATLPAGAPRRYARLRVSAPQ